MGYIIIWRGDMDHEPNQQKQLEAFEMGALRRLLRISWTERMSNDRVLTLAGV